jgi:hydroxymethylglutaryl-CoA reductase
MDSTEAKSAEGEARLPEATTPLTVSTKPRTRLEKLASQVRLLRNISCDLDSSSNIKIENHVGFAAVPIGPAGPLTVNGSSQTRGNLYGPLATVEPTLIAACFRGCKVFSSCGGISTATLDEVYLALLSTFGTLPAALAFYRLVPSLLGDFKAIAERTSRHATLLSLSPRIHRECCPCKVHILLWECSRTEHGHACRMQVKGKDSIELSERGRGELYKRGNEVWSLAQ